jgi:hypothetical protein
MDFLNRIYKKSDAIVFRKIADEYILVPIRNNVGDLESIYTLNEVGARIWELVDGKTKIGDIKERLVEEHDVTPEEAEKDILEYMQQLEEIKAIIEG